MKFEVGDLVIHPKHGQGKVIGYIKDDAKSISDSVLVVFENVSIDDKTLGIKVVDLILAKN